MTIHRREFLKMGVNGLAFCYISGLQELFAKTGHLPTKRNYLIGSHVEKNQQNYEDASTRESRDTPGFLCKLNLSTGDLWRFPMPIWAHSYNQHPLVPHEALGVGKWTESAIVVDLRDGKIMSTLKAPQGYRFFGHASFNPTGTRVMISADSNKYDLGGLCIYNTKNWQLEKILDPGCRFPHECILSLDQQIIVCGKGLSKQEPIGIVSVIDPETDKVVKKIVTPPAAHLIQIGPDELVLSGGPPYLQAAHLNYKTGAITSILDSSDFPKSGKAAEGLSLASISPGKVAITLPELSELLIWNFKTNRVKFFKLNAKTFGIASVGSGLYTNEAQQGYLRKMIFRDGSRLITLAVHGKEKLKFGNGKHLRVMSF